MTYKKSEGGKSADYSGTSCRCGRHYGLGSWDAETRAAIYAWYRDYYPSRYGDEQKIFLADFQREHGHQEPNMHVKHVHAHEINPKWLASKRQLSVVN